MITDQRTYHANDLERDHRVVTSGRRFSDVRQIVDPHEVHVCVHWHGGVASQLPGDRWCDAGAVSGKAASAMRRAADSVSGPSRLYWTLRTVELEERRRWGCHCGEEGAQREQEECHHCPARERQALRTRGSGYGSTNQFRNRFWSDCLGPGHDPAHCRTNQPCRTSHFGNAS